MNLNHVHFGTKDVKALQDFYWKYFDFEKKSDHGKGVFLRNSSGFLIAIDPVAELPRFPDWYHLGFCLDTEAEVFALYSKMKVGKVDIVRDMKAEPGSYASFFVRDPDGNKLEISWHLS